MYVNPMCTRIFWSDNGVAKVAGRTLDLCFVDDPRLWWLPSGLKRRSPSANRPVEWTSQHSSLVITEWGDVCLDGMNERGLGAHALMYTSAEYEPADDRGELATTSWVQYVLDNYSTVAEAVRGLADVRIAPGPIKDLNTGLHLAIEDASGDSAIFEPIEGVMVVHHGPQYRIMANDPSLDRQMANLTRYRPFGGDLPPPGDIISSDRFVRASYFHHYLPEPTDSRMAVVEVMQVLNTVAKPFGVPYPRGDVYPTRWLSAIDLTNLDYYFWSRTSPTALWVSLADFVGGNDIKSVDLLDAALSGDITAAMVPTPLATG